MKDADATSTPAAASRLAPDEALLARFVALARAGQRPATSHFGGDADFKANGLRRYARYRDLGVAEATGGLVQAHVIRMVPPCPPEANAEHLHETVFQIMYVLQGWIKVQLEGRDAEVMRAGSCWTQPPSIRHRVLDYSGDLEVLEILLPADFRTVNT
ncbi:MAG: hypothetical protein BroJett026_17620 [Betaproteobacteria bacterium]|nr:MAG: hypothetical protein BroJett026_17620 [Betaproteobacteria bacterium]